MSRTIIESLTSLVEDASIELTNVAIDRDTMSIVFTTLKSFERLEGRDRDEAIEAWQTQIEAIEDRPEDDPWRISVIDQDQSDGKAWMIVAVRATGDAIHELNRFLGPRTPWKAA